jgi:hypothetical protein
MLYLTSSEKLIPFLIIFGLILILVLILTKWRKTRLHFLLIFLFTFIMISSIFILFDNSYIQVGRPLGPMNEVKIEDKDCPVKIPLAEREILDGKSTKIQIGSPFIYKDIECVNYSTPAGGYMPPGPRPNSRIKYVDIAQYPLSIPLNIFSYAFMSAGIVGVSRLLTRKKNKTFPAPNSTRSSRRNSTVYTGVL